MAGRWIGRRAARELEAYEGPHRARWSVLPRREGAPGQGFRAFVQVIVLPRSG